MLNFHNMAQLLEALTTDPRVCDSSPWHDQTFTQSCELSVIPGVGIARCGHIERKGKDTGPGHCWISISFSVS